jgi:hypothetical protein
MGVVVNMDPVNPQDIYIDMNTGEICSKKLYLGPMVLW